MDHVPIISPSESEFANPIDYLSEPSIQRLGRHYGMVKLIPPANFKPPFCINRETFKFHVRVQNLSELNILNRCRLFFIKQLNNYNRASSGKNNANDKTLSNPYVKLSTGETVYLYDLFIEILKYFNDGENNNRKRSRNLQRIINFPSLQEISRDTRLWKNISHRFKMDYKSLQEIFANYIENYYEYLATQTKNRGSQHLSKLLYQEEYPKSLLSDDDASGEEEDSEDEEDEGCAVCNRNTKPTKMILCDSCDKPFHIFCLSPPLDSIPKGDWICNNCIIGNGYYGFREETRHYSLEEFQNLWNNNEKSLTTNAATGEPLSIEQLEEKFWQHVDDMENSLTVKYGADLHGEGPGEISGFPSKDYKPPESKIKCSDQDFENYTNHPMNLLNLPDAKGSLLPMFDRKISGMTIPWIYVGSTFSTFCWHLEDQYTLSANYQHEGAPKVWYSIPEGSCDRFNQLMKDLAPDLFEKQPDLLHQLVTLISPYDEKFKKAGIKCFKAVQQPNEYIITFPKCYHAGFNSGYNFNEAVNFTLDSWVPYGVEAVADYRSTGKHCVFDMFELMLNVVIESVHQSSKFQRSLVENCFREVRQILNSNVKTIEQLLSSVLRKKFVLGRTVRDEFAHRRKGNLVTQDSQYSQEQQQRGSDDDEDFDVFCTKCKTICSLAFVLHYKNGSNRKRRKIQSMTPTQLNELANNNNGELEILCLDDYVKLVYDSDIDDQRTLVKGDDEDIDPFENDELNYVRDPDELYHILNMAGKALLGWT
ncbi:hypothetical protein ZYGR_0N00590 [Zygosaccharomyces rouxii]|uniref:Histone demethylase JHD2 n=1 Tax=Zygosaccharomyces rouxii TaxID=4956 RepID=A0A1Q2ZYX7_ZYGRO|nr:hypothetical protein ZYGR_0N00590 [Zygosaccharomyces rouxii]